MLDTNLEEPILLTGLPRLDRFFPNCLLGLVELMARTQYGFPDVKRCWYGNSFVFTRTADTWLHRNGAELGASIDVLRETAPRAVERLTHYYGIRFEKEHMHSFDQLLQVVHACLRKGEPALTCFDLAFLDQNGRSRGGFKPHMVGVIGCDLQKGRIRLLEMVRGELDLELDDYASSFERFQAHGLDFYRIACTCSSPGVMQPMGRDAILADLGRSVANFSSKEANLGINALRRLLSDATVAFAETGKPFLIPGLWIFSHDRHALKKVLPVWREALPESAWTTLATIDDGLSRAFDLWFQVDMATEGALANDDLASMQRGLQTLEKVIAAEVELTDAYQRLFAELQD